MAARKKNIVGAYVSQEPAIGPWLWALQDSRQRTLTALEQVTPAMVNWVPSVNESSIGTILYHLADIEADWLYAEVLEEPFPPSVTALFPYPTRDSLGQMTQVLGFSLSDHLSRLESVRSLVLALFQPMNVSEFRRIRSLPDYDVTPEWVLHHLMQHEAEHRSQIGALRMRAEQHLASG